LTGSTGSGNVVLATSPTLVTPVLGTPSSGTLTNCTFPTLNQNTTGTASNVTGTVAVANGGTGQTTYTNGQILIGNTTGNTLTKATLSVGTGISVTNGTGSISIANTGVTSIVAGTGISISGATGAVTVTNSVSVNTSQLAKAWVQFAGSTGTIAGSYNVSSITRTSTGYYTVNFTSTLANANYTANVNASANGASYSGACGIFNDTGGNAVAPTTSLFKFTTAANGGSSGSITLMDATYVSVVVFN
jgi:hypothetical protein